MSKHSISKVLLIAFVVTTLAGACLHFLYDFLPSPVTALIAPVNESIWEHLKLVYWPYLAAMWIVTRKAGKDSRGGWLLTLLIISVAMLTAGYVYYILLGRDSRAFGLSLYVILMALGFWLPGRLSTCGKSKIIPFLVILLGAMILLFTFLPPDNILFADLTTVHTWYTIPC